MQEAKNMQIEELAKYRNQVRVEATSTKKEVNKPNFNKTKEEEQRDQPPREPYYTYYTSPQVQADLISYIKPWLLKS